MPLLYRLHYLYFCTGNLFRYSIYLLYSYLKRSIHACECSPESLATPYARQGGSDAPRLDGGVAEVTSMTGSAMLAMRRQMGHTYT